MERKKAPKVKAEERVRAAVARLAAAAGPAIPALLLERAADANEWENAEYRRRRPAGSRPSPPLGLCELVKAAPPEVNPLLSWYVLELVRHARTGARLLAFSRPELREALAAAVPSGGHKKRQSLLTLSVFQMARNGMSDESLAEHFGKSIAAIRTLKSQGKKQAGGGR